MEKTNKKYLEEIIRVDHAGERGAIKIYEGQLLALKTFKQDEDLKRQIVWTNGVFDILHEGHFRLLRHAKSKGRKLVVGINSDASTKRLKGEDRPINNQLQRKMNLELLPWIDEVVIFDEDTPINSIERFQPDLIVKGGDYTVDTVVGHELAEVDIFPTVKDQSTTNIIEKMKI